MFLSWLKKRKQHFLWPHLSNETGCRQQTLRLAEKWWLASITTLPDFIQCTQDEKDLSQPFECWESKVSSVWSQHVAVQVVHNICKLGTLLCPAGNSYISDTQCTYCMLHLANAQMKFRTKLANRVEIPLFCLFNTQPVYYCTFFASLPCVFEAEGLARILYGSW